MNSKQCQHCGIRFDADVRTDECPHLNLRPTPMGQTEVREVLTKVYSKPENRAMSNPIPNPHVPRKQVLAGQEVDFELKNPWASKRWWGILVSVVGALVTCALALGYVTQEQVDHITESAGVIIAAISTVIGVVIAVVGSFKAKRPLGNVLGTNAGKTITKTVTMIALAIVMTGCMSRAEHAAIRDGIVQSRSIADEEHLAWARTLAGDNNDDGLVTDQDGEANLNNLPQIGKLSVKDRNTWLSAREREHTEYNKLIEASRKNDQLFGGPSQ